MALNIAFDQILNTIKTQQIDVVFHTNLLTYDSSEYSHIIYNSAYNYGGITTAPLPKVIFLVKTKDNVALPTSKEKILQLDIISENELTKVTIKGKRNFLNNNITIK